MKGSSAGARAHPEHALPEIPDGARRERLVRWLDAGLRRGERGRLAREYPLSMAGTRGHRCIFEGETPVAHAMLHPVEAVSRGRSLRLGLIGNVYTEPARRGLGLARACIEACVEDARSLGLPLALLWSEEWDFYRRLGFLPAGRETQLRLDAGVLRRARSGSEPVRVGPPLHDEWPQLEALYREKPQHGARRAGDLARLAAAPETTLRVARVAGRLAGYAAAGRGDDFRGAIHEWAGSESAVIACLHTLHEETGAAILLCGPEEEPVAARLRRAGASAADGCFGLARLLDADALWRALAPASKQPVFSQCGARVAVALDRARAELGPEAALDLFFGGGPAGPGERGLPRRIRRLLAPILPWPLYLWGFDSI